MADAAENTLAFKSAVSQPGVVQASGQTAVLSGVSEALKGLPVGIIPSARKTPAAHARQTVPVGIIPPGAGRVAAAPAPSGKDSGAPLMGILAPNQGRGLGQTPRPAPLTQDQERGLGQTPKPFPLPPDAARSASGQGAPDKITPPGKSPLLNSLGTIENLG
ncbi:MAG: hypothetical protein LBM00_06945, partial [Deltaproteobacteria bacterium]|nr:hypothetical protein [Deltaproteobacteria bacterium]